MRFLLFILIFYSLLEKISSDCETYEDQYKCGKSNINDWDIRCFQTPPKNRSDYKTTYQDMHYIVGYTQLQYFNDYTFCKIIIFTKINTDEVKSPYKLIYHFGDITQEDINYIVYNKENGTFPNGVSLEVEIYIDSQSFAKLTLEEEYFIWDSPLIINNDSIYENGQKGAIVELFGWPYDDIAEECDILSVAGYLGVKIGPPNEQVLTTDWIEEDGLNPWEYFRQPVSYKLITRSGNKAQLRKMINKCRLKGIRIYSRVVINQMTYNGNDVDNHYRNCKVEWGSKSASAGSPFYNILGRIISPYTNKIPTFEYPAVPYCGSDIRCISSSRNLDDLDSTWIRGSLTDLDTGKEYVRQRIADFLTELISIGISGFSIYNGVYISTEDYSQIFRKFRQNLEILPSDFFVIFELNFTTDEQRNYFMCNSANSKNYGLKFEQKLSSNGFTSDDIYKFKFQIHGEDIISKYNFCSNSEDINREKYILVLETELNQLSDDNNIKNKITSIDAHRALYKSMLTDSSESKIRIVFSSYSLINYGTGFPDGYSAINGEKNVPYEKAYRPLSKGYDTGDKDNWIEGNYTRIHRDLEIVNYMRQWMNLEPLTEDELYLEERYKVYGYPTSYVTTVPLTTIPTTIPVTIPTTIPTTIPSSFREKNDTVCTIEEYLNNLCLFDNIGIDEVFNEIIKDIEEQLQKGYLDDLIENTLIKDKKDLIISSNNTIVQITSSLNQNTKLYSNVSTIRLNKCEDILKYNYNISSNDSIIIFKIEYYIEGQITPYIIYEVFHPETKEQLNLELCKNTSISILHPAVIDISNLDIYNISSDYYNDRCYSSSSNNSTDKTLDVRQEEYSKLNLSLCESNCEYNGYDTKRKKVICECEINLDFDIDVIKDMDFDEKKFWNNFKNLKNYINLYVLECYYILFTYKGFQNNLGSAILIPIIIYYFLSINYFVMRGYKIFKTNIKKKLRKFFENMEKNKDDKSNDNINENLRQEIFNKNSNNNNENNDYLDIEKIKNKLSSQISILYPPKKKIKIKIKVKKKIKKTIYSKNIDFSTSKSANSFYLKNKNFSHRSKTVQLSNGLILNSNNESPIKMTINNIKIKENEDNIEYIDYNDYELNWLKFENSIKYDKRTYCQYYVSLLKTKHIIIMTFFNNNDYNSVTVKICLFLFSFSLNYTINALFYTNKTMNKIYEEQGKFDFLYRLPQILYSTIISTIINYLMNSISLTQKNVLALKKKDNSLSETIHNRFSKLFFLLKLKFTLFFDISIIFLLFFWYYISCFSAVYKNTQFYVIKDTLISFGILILYQLIINLIPGFFRISAIKENKPWLYTISHIFQFL